jgi:plastocyanin
LRRSTQAVLFAAALFCALSLLPASASADSQTTTFRSGPIEIGPYQVKQDDYTVGIPKPAVDGYITGMDVDLVDADGSKVPIQRIMLHHIVFSNVGRFVGDRRDGTCSNFTLLDSRTQFAALAERFYAAGEERAQLKLPPGYGYPVKSKDLWLMTWMLMNHQNKRDTVYIEYHVTYDTSPDLMPVKPYWLDVRNCRADPVFDVPGGGKPGSTYDTTSDWTVPESGRIVAGGGHVHGGAKNLAISEPDCSNRRLFTSKPLWGNPDHPFYTVRPILHEPGPINMSGFTSEQGIPVAKGERVRLTARYDNELPHTRVMGISLVYLASDSGVKKPCGPMPTDMSVYKSPLSGRDKAPKFTVPIVAVGPDGVARDIKQPPGKRVDLRSGATIDAHNFYFAKRNVEVKEGAKLRWRFDSSTLHNVTVASGPRGFSSVHLSDGRTYSTRLKAKGTYRIFCALHPVAMTETVKVVK